MAENITIRPLKPDEWQDLKAVRLESLQNHPDTLSATYAEEKNKTDEQWRAQLNSETQKIFGLFDDKTIIGITAIYTSKDHPNNIAGVFAKSYIKPAYRGQGLSNLLYKTRIEWALKESNYKILINGHREGNLPSQKSMIKYGFTYTHTELWDWPNGEQAPLLWYKLDLEKLRT